MRAGGGGGSTVGATRSGGAGAATAGAAAGASAGRAAARVVTGFNRAMGGAGDAATATAAGGGAGAFTAGLAAGGFTAVDAAALGARAFGLAGGSSTDLSRTPRTRSAIWSGTTLSWFFASKTPPNRSLKSAVSSFEVSPTSFASSKIRTFPAKFTLERRAPESHQLECAEPQPTAWLR
jgi:hypothetical protein